MLILYYNKWLTARFVHFLNLLGKRVRIFLRYTPTQTECTFRCSLARQSLPENPRRFVSLSEREVIEAVWEQHIRHVS
jgi:hypothetical protein